MARSRREAPRGRDLRTLVAAHVERLRVRGFAASTVQHRALYLARFLAWCKQRGIRKTARLSPALLAEWPSRQADELRAVRLFCRWLCREGVVSVDPAAGVELPRVARALPRVLTESQVERVLAQPSVARFWGLRSRAAMEVLYGTGLRRQELLDLRWADVDRAAGTVLVRHGKNGKDRVVPIGERALHWLDRYARRLPRPSDRIFPMTPGAFGNLIARQLRAAGLGGHGQCHLFRHTAATLMLRHGADIRSIQEMLGHAKLSTTEVYTHVSIRDLKRIHRATHPAEAAERYDPSR